MIPLDDERRWYRYHPVWRSFLSGELESSGEDIPSLLNRAADWHEHEGHGAEAFDLACRSRDVQRAGHI